MNTHWGRNERPGPDDGFKFFKGVIVGLVLVSAFWIILAVTFGWIK